MHAAMRALGLHEEDTGQFPPVFLKGVLTGMACPNLSLFKQALTDVFSRLGTWEL